MTRLARMADHIPDRGKHRTLFYGHYANRARGARAKGKGPPEGEMVEASKKRHCRASWARLISKVCQVDPLQCRGCGGKLQIVAYINDHFTIKKILDHLGLSPPEKPRPPPEVEYVSLDDEGRELGTVDESFDTP